MAASGLKAMLYKKLEFIRLSRKCLPSLVNPELCHKRCESLSPLASKSR
jgi:hypothetical protein